MAATRKVAGLVWAALAVVATLGITCTASTPSGECSAGSSAVGYSLEAVYNLPLDRYDFVYYDAKGGQLVCQVQEAVIMNGLANFNAVYKGYFGGECTCRGRRYGRAVYSDAFLNPPANDVCQVCEIVAEAGPSLSMVGFDASTLQLEGRAGLTYTLLSLDSKKQHESVHANIQLASRSSTRQAADGAGTRGGWLSKLNFFRNDEAREQTCVSGFAVMRGSVAIAAEARKGGLSATLNGQPLELLPTERLELGDELVVRFSSGDASKDHRRQMQEPVPFLATHGRFPASLLFGSSRNSAPGGSLYVSHPLFWFIAEGQPSDQGCLKVTVGLYRPVEELQGQVQGLLGLTMGPAAPQEAAAAGPTIARSVDAEAFLVDGLTTTFTSPNVYYKEYSKLAEQKLVSSLASAHWADDTATGSAESGAEAIPTQAWAATDAAMGGQPSIETDMMRMMVLEGEAEGPRLMEAVMSAADVEEDDVNEDSEQLLALQDKLLQQSEKQGRWEQAWLQAEEFGEEGDAPVLVRRSGPA